MLALATFGIPAVIAPKTRCFSDSKIWFLSGYFLTFVSCKATSQSISGMFFSVLKTFWSFV